MKILTIHADFIAFQAKKEVFKGAEADVEKGHEERIEECLVVFTAFEKTDESDIPAIVKRYVHETRKIAEQVNTEKIVLYPYAHLSSHLGDPKMAVAVMKQAQQILSEDFKVSRAPFGWYKSFNISCKGHPLSELSREFGPEEALNIKRESKDEAFQLESKKLSQEEKINYTTAALMAKAVNELFPESELGSLGFHLDHAYADFANLKIKPGHFQKIEVKMQELVGKDLVIAKTGKENVTIELQKSIAVDLGKHAEAYQINDLTFVPLYKDPFVYSLNEISAFKIMNMSSSYWKGNDANAQLLRLFVVGFISSSGLNTFLQKRKDAENRSHLKIGKEQGLFVVSKLVGAGLPLLAPKGMILREEITTFLWDLHKDKGYSKVWIPHIAKEDLYKKSGHWEKFGDELFRVKGKTENFVMKPMNCPHHIQIFDNFSYSYKDLPVRYFEPTTVYRDEKSGQLLGLSRVRAITQDDGHIFCRVDQIKEEVATMVEIIGKFYKILGMDKDYWVSLSVRGEDKSKYLGTEDVWKIAESALENAADENKLPYKKIEGEAAFYGPKLDFMFKDSMGREWQLATIQLDFNLPERFDLSYMDAESKKVRPVMIHRAISGSLERFMSVLIEHFAGKFPLWLSPVQVKVITITDRNNICAEEVVAKMKVQGIRVELDERSESMGKKVRDAQMENVNYIVTIGDKEMDTGTVAVRLRNGDQKLDVPVEQFISELVKERDEKLIL